MSQEPTIGSLIVLLQTNGIDVNFHVPTSPCDAGYILHLYDPRKKTHAKVIYHCKDEASVIAALFEAEKQLSEE